MVHRSSRWLGGCLSGVVLGLMVVTACQEESEPTGDGSAGQAPQDAGAGGQPGGAGAGGSGGAGAGGDGPLCDCGDDPSFIHAPLECACRAGYCDTLDPNPKFQGGYDFGYGWPYVILFGRCTSGHHVVSYGEACENGGRSVYDERGQLAYKSYGPYGNPPAICAQQGDGFGNFGIGENDPSEDCDYCVLGTHDDPVASGAVGGGDGANGGAGGADAGGAGGEAGSSFQSCYEEELEMYPRCGPEFHD